MAPDDPLTRTALVTGAARGIGRATVDALAASGWQVVAGVRDASTLESPITHRAVHVLTLDVTDSVSIRDAVGQAEDIAAGPLALRGQQCGLGALRRHRRRRPRCRPS